MICVSIKEKSPQRLGELVKNADMAEIRLDLIKPSLPLVRRIFSGSPVEMIATCRPGEYDDKRRAVLLKQSVDAGAGWIDMETDSETSFREDVASYATNKGCGLIISYHNFTTTPTAEELEQITAECFKMGAGVAKIACMAFSGSDVAKILSLYSKFENLVAISMGEAGKISRVAALKLGAPFTFASAGADASTAPGQMTEGQIRKMMEILHI